MIIIYGVLFVRLLFVLYLPDFLKKIGKPYGWGDE